MQNRNLVLTAALLQSLAIVATASAQETSPITSTSAVDEADELRKATIKRHDHEIEDLRRNFSTILREQGEERVQIRKLLDENERLKLALRVAVATSTAGMKSLESRVDDLEDSTSHQTFGLGTTLAVNPGGSIGYGLETNLRYFWGAYYVNTGFMAGLEPSLDVWRFKLHWLRAGIMKPIGSNALGTPDTATDFNVVIGALLDFRIWSGLEISGGVMWLFPQPFRYLSKDESKINDAVQKLKQQIQNLKDESGAVKQAIADLRHGALTQQDIDALNNSNVDVSGIDLNGLGQDLGSAYVAALKTPIINFRLRWEF